MDRPTKEQIAEARAYFDPKRLEYLELDRHVDTVQRIRVLLAATAEPTLDELDAEAARVFWDHESRYAYRCGARREGAR